MTDPLRERCAAIVGAPHVLSDPEDRAGYETDWTGRFHGVARFVVRPANTDEVAATVRACTDARAALVPQGGNTGLVGGSVPGHGDVVLSVRRLQALGPVDTVAGEVTVGAGVTLEDLRNHALAAGWDFGVDLASRGSATVGGMIATNAGGIRVLRHGPMRLQLLGIEAVLADARVIRRMPGLKKDNTGYDIPGLLAGSEGTLAVVTAAHLRLTPIKPSRVTALLRLATLRAALRAVQSLRSVSSLDAVEVFFPEGVALVCRHAGLEPPFATPDGVYLLVECAGQHDPTGELAAALETISFEDSAIATERPGRERLWAYRERHTEAINAEGVPHKLDVSLPLARMEEFTARVRPALEDAVPGARPILFGHLADGNLHVNVLGAEPDDERPDDAVFRLVASLGGSISAEHGIGRAKRRWLTLTRSPEDIAAMRAIKQALDPHGILNPGVLFP
jgi:FAD/FMN-containing dehydrogenase